jgi:site-specific DNA-methyltransferase (adenine-specific)
MAIELLHIDCMEYMRGLPDKAFDLAIVDPPYGIGEDGGKCRTRGSSRTNGPAKEWDSERPCQDYFRELERVSHHRIIWGGNYFADLLPASRCWLYWQKDMGGDFADGELAWTSFDAVLRQFRKRSETFNRIHPTQKPVALYRWLLKNYAKPGQRILDTHLGSGSIAIACDIEGFDLVGCEIDADYIAGARKRLADHQAQPRLFDQPPPAPVQSSIDL